MALSLAIKDLHAGYGAVKALRGVTLNVETGETVALLGTNGNGKSTLMKCIAGLVRPQRGAMSLTIDGKVHDLTRLSAEAIVDLGVALVPEGRRILLSLTIEENLLMGAYQRHDREIAGDLSARWPSGAGGVTSVMAPQTPLETLRTSGLAAGG